MDFLAGALSGYSQTIVGHPFDTIKVLQQNKIKTNEIISKIKPNRLYKGVLYPSISNTIVNSILFSTYNKTNQLVGGNHFLSGMASGFVVSPLVFMFDIGKVKRQLKQKLHFEDFYKTKGLSITFLRETFAFGIYFQTYNTLKNDFNMNTFYAGAISGLANWTSTYTLDVIRNRQIATNCSIINAYSIGNLWKGYPICATRALIVNSVGFYVYELIMNL